MKKMEKHASETGFFLGVEVCGSGGGIDAGLSDKKKMTLLTSYFAFIVLFGYNFRYI